MERHGSESYFVVGEGLLGESVGGRESTLAPAVAAAAPPFRFSRMGPKGSGHQLTESNRKKLAAPWSDRPAANHRFRRASPTSASSSITI